MRILLAAPDRDLLECYQEILKEEFGEVVSAFEGTQVLSLLKTENFDAVVLDQEIPRVDTGRLLREMNDRDIPVILLRDSAVTAHELESEDLASTYLSYPFYPDEIIRAVRETREKAQSAEKLRIDGCGIEIEGFRIVGGPRVTSGEIDVLRTLLGGGTVTADEGAYISALNNKFAGIGALPRIRYRAEKGFELVTTNE